MTVRACICHDLSFERLRAIAQSRGLDLQALKDATGCCTSCSLCEPFVRLMLKTGRTEFDVNDAPPKSGCDANGPTDPR